MIKNDLTVIVLTFNEEIHLNRCLANISLIADRIVIVDSGSVDNTKNIADSYGADFYYNKFSSHAAQFNWALNNININTEWVMKIDADEYCTNELIEGLPHVLQSIEKDISGITINLRRIFMNKWIRHGAIYPIKLLRIWRFSCGVVEDKLMDEHVVVNGKILDLGLDFCDHNINNITWWTEKHNRYASREAIDLLDMEYNFLQRPAESHFTRSRQARVKRFIKEYFYSKLPCGFRAILYFMYRYFIRLGFLDGLSGSIFHVLQGFWYRYLVDVKVLEVKNYMRENDADIVISVKEVLGLEIK